MRAHWKLPRYSWRGWIGVAVLVLYAAASSVPRLRATADALLRPPASDPVSDFESQIAELRSAIPPRGVVGYVSDPPREGVTREESRDHFRRFILTQYSLIPVVVQRGPAPDTIVGSFPPPSSGDTVRVLGLTVLRDFGNGILLLERR
jgi:hypothetical protein